MGGVETPCQMMLLIWFPDLIASHLLTIPPVLSEIILGC